jgi:hypothetical protein
VPIEIPYAFFIDEHHLIDNLYNIESPKSNLIKNAYRNSFSISKRYIIADPLAIAVAFCPELVKSYI